MDPDNDSYGVPHRPREGQKSFLFTGITDGALYRILKSQVINLEGWNKATDFRTLSSLKKVVV